eukprot:m.289829 g.289829  ORF g.289829 m.289829 type:complete len:184 (+) comp12199_c0_seq1:148-699(+)
MARTVSVLLATAALLAVAAAVDFEFTTEFVGSCQNVGPKGQPERQQICTFKGQSQIDTSIIDDKDAVFFTSKSLIGSYALMTSQLTMNGDTFHERGNITFGTHQSQNHALAFETYGRVGGVTLEYPGEKIDAFALTAHITGGTGSYVGARGIVSYAGHTTEDGQETIRHVTVIANHGGTEDEV